MSENALGPIRKVRRHWGRGLATSNDRLQSDSNRRSGHVSAPAVTAARDFSDRSLGYVAVVAAVCVWFTGLSLFRIARHALFGTGYVHPRWVLTLFLPLCALFGATCLVLNPAPIRWVILSIAGLLWVMVALPTLVFKVFPTRDA